jgi:hypothetical protein
MIHDPFRWIVPTTIQGRHAFQTDNKFGKPPNIVIAEF